MRRNENLCPISAVIVSCVLLASVAAAELFPMRQQIPEEGGAGAAANDAEAFCQAISGDVP